MVIVGGGVAGFAAALAAIERNKKVILIEKQHQLGGNAIQSNVGTICGAFYNSKTQKPIDHPLIQFVLGEVGNEPIYNQGLWIVPYDVENFNQIIKKALDHELIQVLLNTEVTSVFLENSLIKEIQVQTSESQINVTAGSYVDGSGNGIISQLAGLEMLRSDSYQAASQVFRVINVDSENEFSLNFAIRKIIVELTQQNKLPEELKSLSAIPGSLKDNRVDLKFTVPGEVTDSINQENLNSKGKEFCEIIFNHLKTNTSSFKDSSIEKIYPNAGIRVLQRSKGKYVLTEEDVLEGKKINDAAAIGTWPIEEWDHTGKVHLSHLPEDDFYEIPPECLMSYKIENLFLAGKNISATEKAIGSARVIGTCLQTGYTAGMMAADIQ